MKTVFYENKDKTLKRERFILILCVLTFFRVGTEDAVFGMNADNYYFRHYTNRDGLSHNTVYCSLQDSRGFVWFGTDDGLNRFDGYSFRIFRRDDRPGSDKTLQNDRIISLFEDSSGRIWVCTLGGVCYYDYETDTFYPFRLDAQSPVYYSEQILEDREGNLWFRDYFNIMKYNFRTKTSSIYHFDDYNLHSVTVAMTEQGIPIFADAMSLFTYNPVIDKFNRIVSLYDYVENKLNVITSLLEVPQGSFFIGTDLEGLIFYNRYSKQLETIIPNIHVRSITRFSANVYWIASESGVFIYNLIDKSVTNLRKSLVNDYAIADNAVYSIIKDREGGVWVSSFFGGINYLPGNHNQFTRYIGGKTHPGMLGNTVREICPDKYGNLWLGTEDNGINHFNPKTNVMIHYSLCNDECRLITSNIHGLYADGDTLWIGYFNQGIDLFHIPTGKILKNYNHTNNGLSSNFILCFYKTKKGDLLVGTSVGVDIYDKKTDAFSKWKDAFGMVRQITEDKKGNIWAATNNGLYKYTPSYTDTDGTLKEERLAYYAGSQGRDGRGLGTSNITSVFEDSKGRIWVATYYGLSLYNEYTDSFSRITTKDGLPANVIYRIVEDENNMFWISTSNGLVQFNPDTHSMHTYSYTDGLHETQFNFSSSYKDENGTIYMGTVNGMISFTPGAFTKDMHVPSLYITRVQAPENPHKDKYPVNDASGNPYELRLPYNSATVTISYIALSYTSPDAVKYAYMLEGSDKEWVYMGTNREVTFASLAPGDYTFKVRSTNSSGMWQDNEQILHIVITPPFWATSWAIIFYIFLLSGLAVVFYRYKKQSFIRNAQRNQELFEVEKEKELYNAKIQFFTFITHEIRTPLTLIKAPLEKIINSGEGTENTKQNLMMIEKNTQRLLALSNQLLDFRKTESRGFRLNFVKTNVSVVLDNILIPFLSAFKDENKRFSADLPEKHLFAYIDRDAFIKIMTNLLSNALKYSGEYIHLEVVAASNPDGNFKIAITNDGLPIPAEEREQIFKPFYRMKETETIQGSGIGLSLSRTLADFHNGSLIYEATNDGMSRFILTLPVRQKDYNFDLGESQTSEEDGESEVVVSSGKRKSDKPVLLIVEDQPCMRKFISEEIKNSYETLEAGNGKEALDLLNKNMVHLIISDIMMPVMDGFELCNAVKNDVRFSHIPFIILTAQHNMQSRLKGLNKGADAYMEKPFSLEHLHAQIENLLKSRLALHRSYLEKPLIPIQSLVMTPVDDIFINKLNGYIEAHLTNKNISMEMLAGEMNMSSSSLYRKVKGISGLSPVDFIRMVRLKKAVEIMRSGEKRINEIAFLVGFSSPAYFSTIFQRQYGKSPSEYMKNMN
ncbi:MAG: response regulator [Tannerella sp.]|jgi:ligand-binding sensor domain-containing protein/signal transduction histidine kinase/DNA-binding response OmpR family regulator|nr:response regulator [Tannerella sp.]